MPTTSMAATARMPVSDATRSTPETCSSPPWASVSSDSVIRRVFCAAYPHRGGAFSEASRLTAPAEGRSAHPRCGCAQAFSASPWAALAGSSTSEKSGPMVMWPKSLRCSPPSLAMAPTIAPGPTLCRLPTAMR